MPANLPAEAEKALAKYQAARTIEEKIRALEEALSLIPDHKGTEKLRGRIKRRIAELRREAERKASLRAVRRDYFHVPKEGAAQVVLIGAANSGKSSLLRALTNAKPQVSGYPLTTTMPVPGMMLYNDVEIQLIELPAILTEDLEETQFTNRSIGFSKNADLIVIVLDGARGPAKQLERILEIYDESGVSFRRKRCEIEIEKKDSGGIRLVVFGSLGVDVREVEDLLRSVGIRNAVVRVRGEASIEDFEEVVIREMTHKRGLIAVNKIDQAAPGSLEEVKNIAGEIPVVAVSAENGAGLEDLKRQIFNSLDLIRVYTRKAGITSDKPIILPRNSTIRDLAEIIHRDFAEKMKYARVWGASVKVQGQRVGPDHVLEDGDIVEIKI
ncbi:MAG: TGS domain-containing protein [Thaumarchaeota archaeon]|jgi:ribosome-interacting GTPase 1|nr:TGS domain-containing protein [Candidatus Wolframiiraptor allenii]